MARQRGLQRGNKCFGFESPMPVLEALVLGANHRLHPLRARSALASGQWVYGFIPSRGIRCGVTGDAHPLAKTKMNPNHLSSGVRRVKGLFESRQLSKTIENHPRPHSHYQKVQTNHRTSLLRRGISFLETRPPHAKRDRNASLYEFDNYSEDNSKTTTKRNRLGACR